MKSLTQQMLPAETTKSYFIFSQLDCLLLDGFCLWAVCLGFENLMHSVNICILFEDQDFSRIKAQSENEKSVISETPHFLFVQLIIPSNIVNRHHLYHAYVSHNLLTHSTLNEYYSIIFSFCFRCWWNLDNPIS